MRWTRLPEAGTLPQVSKCAACPRCSVYAAPCSVMYTICRVCPCAQRNAGRSQSVTPPPRTLLPPSALHPAAILRTLLHPGAVQPHHHSNRGHGLPAGRRARAAAAHRAGRVCVQPPGQGLAQAGRGRGGAAAAQRTRRGCHWHRPVHHQRAERRRDWGGLAERPVEGVRKSGQLRLRPRRQPLPAASIQPLAEPVSRHLFCHPTHPSSPAAAV